MKVATFGRVEYGGVAWGGEIGVHLHLSEADTGEVSCQHHQTNKNKVSSFMTTTQTNLERSYVWEENGSFPFMVSEHVTNSMLKVRFFL